MDVGVNYPWVDYGWDFGEAPPSWRGAGAEPGWRGRIDEHLSRFAELGLKVVRWFILADGLAYGTGPDAPQRIGPGDQGWSFTPPPLAPALQAHFGQLLERFEAVNHGHASPRITLLPVLVDFLFFQPGAWPVVQVTATGEPPRPDPGWVKGGRADVVNDPSKRRAFLAEALAPLLRISRAHARLIHGWEIVNEPEWVTRGWHPHARRRLPVEASAMRALVEEASAAIRREGFRPTIGFARRETLERTGLFTELNQFHHYADGRRRLVPPPSSASSRPRPRTCGPSCGDPGSASSTASGSPSGRAIRWPCSGAPRPSCPGRAATATGAGTPRSRRTSPASRRAARRTGSPDLHGGVRISAPWARRPARRARRSGA